jgi:His-Xaa-Ser system radical SAM maturase HxsC
MKPLPLSGVALRIVGFPASGRLILRLVRPNTAEGVADSNSAALIRSPSDYGEARHRFQRFVIIGDCHTQFSKSVQAIVLPSAFNYMDEGDIIRVDLSSHKVRSLFRRSSAHNYFLVTERCNHYCLMCSQPPRDVDDSWLLDEIAACVQLLDPAPPSITFTGGEPLLDWQRFIPLLAKVQEKIPTTKIHVLTNGRFFADPRVANSWADLNRTNLSVGIPIYASVDSVHDYVVQSVGALDETIHGILRVKNCNHRVEVRVVLHAITVPHLEETCKWLARNLPFVDHVALMGLENTGFALANHEDLWIDPEDYRDTLAASVSILASAHVPVSVYNLPLCVLEPKIWPYSVQSISDWKNAFLPECAGCAEKPFCGGFFSTGRPKISRGVRPFSHLHEQRMSASCDTKP